VPSKIVVSRRIYLPALIVAVLLIALVIGSLTTRAQGTIEYPIMVICWREGGAIRVVAEPEECRGTEQAGALLTGFAYTQWIEPMMDDIDDLEFEIEELREQLGQCCPP
jgi:hypothetical protein